MFKRTLWIAAMALVAATALHAQTAAYPTKPITFIVPYPAGGPTDVVARAIAEKLAASVGQPVIVDNRPGANESIAAAAVSHAVADGYTLLFATDAALSLNAHLYPKLPYAEADLVPVSRVADAHMLLVVPAQSSTRSLADFVKAAKASPGSISYASAGVGNTSHLSMEWLASLTDMRLTHVPYRGVAPALPDLVANRVGAMFSGASAVLPLIKEGKLMAIATSGTRRSTALPDVPTFAELGYPNFQASFYLGLVAPKGTRPEVVSRLASEVNQIARQPDFRARALQSWGLEMVGDAPQDFAGFLQRERATAARRVQISGAKLE